MDTFIFLVFFLSLFFFGFIVILKRPIIGLLLIIMMNPFDQLIQSQINLPDPFTAGRLLGLLVFTSWLLRFFMTRKSKVASLKRFHLVPLLIIFSMIVSTLMSPVPGMSFSVSLKIIILIMMLLFIQDFITDDKQLKLMIAVIAFTAGVDSLIGLIQFLGYEGYIRLIGNVTNYAREGVRFAAFDSNPNGYGMQLMSGIPFLLFMMTSSKSRLVKYISIIFLITSVASLYLTMSRTHFFGLIIFVVFFVVMKFKYKQITTRQIALVAGMVLLSFLIFSRMPSFVSQRLVQNTFSGRDTSVEARSQVLLKGLDIIEENPIFGTGFMSNSDIKMQAFSGIQSLGGHDLISYYVVGTGLVGGILFVILCYMTFKYLNRAVMHYNRVSDRYFGDLSVILFAGFAALLATFLGNPIVVQRIFWVYVALAAVLYRRVAVEEKAVGKEKGMADNILRRGIYTWR